LLSKPFRPGIEIVRQKSEHVQAVQQKFAFNDV
jgi:hypothetical protein